MNSLCKQNSNKCGTFRWFSVHYALLLPGCSCDDRCLNKVVQFPMQVRLEIFKTKEKGWGVRAVDDVRQVFY